MDQPIAPPQQKFAFQRNVAIAGVVLFCAKLFVWRLTKSDAVFSDAMESIVNIIAAFMGLYSLYLAAKPQDPDHPYGHGKVEFVTAGIEGILIIMAGAIIIVQAVISLVEGNTPEKVDWGIAILGATGAINYFLGHLSIKKGIRENSLVLQSSGKHLQSDTITTAGVVVSLVLVYLTGLNWIDGAVALLFAVYILFTGYKIVRRSLGGIMDEADLSMVERLAGFLNNNRRAEWIDLHNLRIQQFGSKLHIDGHITMPWYFELRTAHENMEAMIKQIVENTDREIEFNFHMDDCKPFCCPICSIKDCPVRQHDFVKKIDWTAETISQPQKHSL